MRISEIAEALELDTVTAVAEDRESLTTVSDVPLSTAMKKIGPDIIFLLINLIYWL